MGKADQRRNGKAPRARGRPDGGMTLSDSELRINADVRPLKEFAREKLPSHSTLRAIILAEPDTMDPQDYFKKTSLWTKLLRKEIR